MRKKLLAFTAAIVITLSLTACGSPDLAYNDSGDNTDSISDNGASDVNVSTSSNVSHSESSSSSSDSGSNSGSDSSSDAISTEPLKVRCGDIIIENDKRTFDVEITFGNAFAVMYHYISSDKGRIENAIPSFKPLGMSELKDILNDPAIGGSDLSESDFELINGVYKMKNEGDAKNLLGSLASTYSFNQYWKNQKLAELISTEGISTDEAYSRVEEMFENMNNNTV